MKNELSEHSPMGACPEGDGSHPSEPRFRRVAALNRTFVDRAPVLAAFAEEWSCAGSQPRLFNVVGVGGIGKSRLLREIKENHCGGARTALVDLQIPTMSQQEDALAALRVELGHQGVRFDRFDIAYAVLWQRLHPHLQLSRTELPFIGESEILGNIVDSVAAVPIVGTAIGLMKLLDRAASGGPTQAPDPRRPHVVPIGCADDQRTGGLGHLPVRRGSSASQ